MPDSGRAGGSPRRRRRRGDMGLLFSALRGLFGNKDVRILILGLDNAGKTTILNKLQFPDEAVSPTVPSQHPPPMALPVRNPYVAPCNSFQSLFLSSAC